ncbi:MAG: anthranilate synthase component I, partial [Shewanella sp.]
MAKQAVAYSNTIKSPATYHSDPLQLFQHITQDAPHTMLLESAEIDSKDHLKSMIMTHAAMMIRCDGYQLTFSALSANGSQLLAPIERFFSASAKVRRDHHLVVVTLEKNAQLQDEDARLTSTSPLDGLRLFIQQIDCGKSPAFEDLFLGGVLAYDLIETVEPLPAVPYGDNDCPDYLFYLAET